MDTRTQRLYTLENEIRLKLSHKNPDAAFEIESTAGQQTELLANVLLKACCENDLIIELHELLKLEYVSDVNEVLSSSRYHETMLQAAAYHQHYDIVVYLVEIYHAKVDQTALSLAVLGGQNLRIAKYLIRHGAKALDETKAVPFCRELKKLFHEAKTGKLKRAKSRAVTDPEIFLLIQSIRSFIKHNVHEFGILNYGYLENIIGGLTLAEAQLVLTHIDRFLPPFYTNPEQRIAQHYPSIFKSAAIIGTIAGLITLYRTLWFSVASSTGLVAGLATNEIIVKLLLYFSSEHKHQAYLPAIRRLNQSFTLFNDRINRRNQAAICSSKTEETHDTGCFNQ